MRLLYEHEHTHRRLFWLFDQQQERKDADFIFSITFCSSHPSVSSLPLNSASASFFSLIFSSSFFRCRSTITLFRKLIWWRQSGENWSEHERIWWSVCRQRPDDLTCPSANSFSSLSCSRAASPAGGNQKACWQNETTPEKFERSDHRPLTWGRSFNVFSLWGLRSHEPLLQTVNATLQLSFVSLQRLHGRLQRLGHGVFSSQHGDLQRRRQRVNPSHSRRYNNHHRRDIKVMWLPHSSESPAPGLCLRLRLQWISGSLFLRLFPDWRRFLCRQKETWRDKNISGWFVLFLSGLKHCIYDWIWQFHQPNKKTVRNQNIKNRCSWIIRVVATKITSLRRRTRRHRALLINESGCEAARFSHSHLPCCSSSPDGDARSLQTSFLLHFAPSPLGFPPGRQHGAVSCSSRRLSFTLLLRSYITQALVFLPQPSVILTLFNIHSQLKSLLRGSGGTF